jgi:hypothetical protein
MNARPDMWKKFDKVVKLGYDMFNFEEIMDGIETGKFQSFAHGDTWVVTRVYDYPRTRILDVLFIVGNREDFVPLDDAVTEFAQKIGADRITATARRGFEDYMLYGWKKTAVVYQKELKNG